MRKTHFKKLVAAVLTGALALQAAFIPVMAEDAGIDSDIPDTELLDEIAALSNADKGDLGVITVDIDAAGSVTMNGASLFEIDAEVVSSADLANGTHSTTGSVSSSGITVDFSEYMDSETIQLKLPGVPMVLSYNYQNDPSGSYLASMVGEDALKVINNALKLVNASTTNPEGMAAFGQEISAIFAEAAGSLKFETAAEKECSIGGKAVVCQGVQAPISKDLIMDTVSKVFDCKLPIGITYGEYFDRIFALQAQTDPSAPKSIKEFIDYTFASMPGELVCAYYVTEDGAPAEIDLTAEGNTLAIQLRGPAGMNWSEIAVTAGDTEIGLLSINMSETGYEASVSVSGQVMATLSINASDMSYLLTSPMLPFEIAGQIIVNEDGSMTLVNNCDNLVVTTTISYGGTVEKPEGDVLELSSMTEQDFAAIASSLASVFGNSFAAAPAA